jgi:SET domain-containing protein
MPAKKSTKRNRATKSKKKPAAPRRRSRPGKPGPVNEWLELRASSIHGLGAFARTDIPKGTRVIEYTGEKISNAEADRRYDEKRMRRHYTLLFVLNDRECVDAAWNGNAARYINHSCAPNCEAEIERGRIWIEAIQRIPAGAELFYDYAYEDESDYTEKDYRFHACTCGAPNCRGTIVDTRKKWRR